MLNTCTVPEIMLHYHATDSENRVYKKRPLTHCFLYSIKTYIMPRHSKDDIRRRIKSLITIQRRHGRDTYSKQGTHNNCSGLLHLNKANRVMTLGVRGWQGGRITATPRSSLRFVSGLGTRFDGNLAVRLRPTR